MHDYCYICSQFWNWKIFPLPLHTLLTYKKNEIGCKIQCRKKYETRKKNHWIKQEVVSIILLEMYVLVDWLHVFISIQFHCIQFRFFLLNNTYTKKIDSGSLFVPHMCVVSLLCAFFHKHKQTTENYVLIFNRIKKDGYNWIVNILFIKGTKIFMSVLYACYLRDDLTLDSLYIWYVYFCVKIIYKVHLSSPLYIRIGFQILHLSRIHLSCHTKNIE